MVQSCTIIKYLIIVLSLLVYTHAASYKMLCLIIKNMAHFSSNCCRDNWLLEERTFSCKCVSAVADRKMQFVQQLIIKLATMQILCTYYEYYYGRDQWMFHLSAYLAKCTIPQTYVHKLILRLLWKENISGIRWETNPRPSQLQCGCSTSWATKPLGARWWGVTYLYASVISALCLIHQGSPKGTTGNDILSTMAFS